MVNGALLEDQPLSLDGLDQHGSGDASQNSVIGRAGDDLALPVTIQALLDDPSVTRPSRSTNQASRAPCSRAACLASTLGRSETDLMSTRAQRLSGTVMTAMPWPAMRLVAGDSRGCGR